MFYLKSNFQPTGDQPQAIEKLAAGVQSGKKAQVLLGITGYRWVDGDAIFDEGVNEFT